MTSTTATATATAERFFRLGRDIAEIEFNKSIAGCYRDGNAEYDAVGVLLLTWADDDMNCREIEVNPLEQVFKEKFNYHTEQYMIPPTESDTSLFNRLDAFVRCYDSPSKLGIIYYGGHAELVDSSDASELQLFARIRPHGIAWSRTDSSLSNLSLLDSPTEVKSPTIFENAVPTGPRAPPPPRPPQPYINFGAICERLKGSELDMLLIVDSCFAAGAFTNQPFGGRKCELFCSIADWNAARGPGEAGSFTKVLTESLVEMLSEKSQGFSTTDLYGRVYRKQDQAHKPFLFTQSRRNYEKIMLRPLPPHDKPKTKPETDSKYTIDVRFHLTRSLNLEELNTVVKALQWIPFVQRIKMQNMRSPDDDLSKFIRTVHMANRLRPLLAQIRHRRDYKQAKQLRRTDTSSPTSPTAGTTSEHFLGKEPRNVELFDWSNATAVTPQLERFSPREYFDLKIPQPKHHGHQLPTESPEHSTMADAALQVYSREAHVGEPVEPSRAISQRTPDTRLSQRALDGLLFFALGVLAPTMMRWAVQGRASLFAVA
jgi:hypothetical protein